MGGGMPTGARLSVCAVIGKEEHGLGRRLMPAYPSGRRYKGYAQALRAWPDGLPRLRRGFLLGAPAP